MHSESSDMVGALHEPGGESPTAGNSNHASLLRHKVLCSLRASPGNGDVN
jgi:hypothetical protein